MTSSRRKIIAVAMAIVSSTRHRPLFVLAQLSSPVAYERSTRQYPSESSHTAAAPCRCVASPRPRASTAEAAPKTRTVFSIRETASVTSIRIERQMGRSLDHLQRSVGANLEVGQWRAGGGWSACWVVRGSVPSTEQALGTVVALSRRHWCVYWLVQSEQRDRRI